MRILALTSALALIPVALAGEASRSYTATAYCLESGDILYSEHHEERWRDGQLAARQVRYEDAAGRLIAEKLVRYVEGEQVPAFEMIDHRTGLREGAEIETDRVVLWSGVDPRPRSVERPPGAVVDAGFDAFMRGNFDAIARGEEVEFDFAVPALGRFIRFATDSTGESVYGGEPALEVRMRPAMRLLRWMVDPIELVYNLDGELLEFRGLSNVKDEDGDRYRARITFDYSGVGEMPAGAP